MNENGNGNDDQMLTYVYEIERGILPIESSLQYHA